MGQDYDEYNNIMQIHGANQHGRQSEKSSKNLSQKDGENDINDFKKYSDGNHIFEKSKIKRKL